MKKKKNLIIKLFIAIFIIITVYAVLFHKYRHKIFPNPVYVCKSLMRAHNNCNVFENFINNLKNDEWDIANGIINTEADEFRIENNKIYYYNHDYTPRFKKGRVYFWKTFDMYLGQNRNKIFKDKVIFSVTSRADYAILENGKIIHVKMP